MTLLDVLYFTKTAFNLPRNLSIGYIYRNWIGPTSSTSRSKWRARCTIISKKAGGNIISILHKITTMSSFIWFKTSNFNVREHKSLKNKHNSINVVRILLLKYQRIATGSNHCKSTWKSWLFIPEIVPSLVFTMVSKTEPVKKP